jgi:hypothetical protein
MMLAHQAPVAAIVACARTIAHPRRTAGQFAKVVEKLLITFRQTRAKPNDARMFAKWGPLFEPRRHAVERT